MHCCQFRQNRYYIWHTVVFVENCTGQDSLQSAKLPLTLCHSYRTTPSPCTSSSLGETSGSHIQVSLWISPWTIEWQTNYGSLTPTSLMIRSPLFMGWQWRTVWLDCTLMELCSMVSGKTWCDYLLFSTYIFFCMYHLGVRKAVIKQWCLY